MHSKRDVRGGLLGRVSRYLQGTEERPSSGSHRVLATVVFTDIVGSTQRVSQMGDRRWRDLLREHDVSVRRQVEFYGGRVLKSLGDGYLAMFPTPARALRGGCAVGKDAESLGLQVKVGVHTGECEVLGDDVAGMAVHIGARVVAKARPGEVLATRAVRDLTVGSGIEFSPRGAHELHGVPGVWDLLAVKGNPCVSKRRRSPGLFPAAAIGLLAMLR